jgi:asparagine synthase (glutamine-hydrolysing)
MCGFFGVYSKKGKIPFSNKKLNEALNLIKHRGPDETKVWKNNNFWVGFHRLSINDIPNGKQPFISNKNISVINGEIFNYIELKEKYNIPCKTNSDCEVLFPMINKKKLESWDIIHGFFAGASYDIEKNELLLCRDLFGKKPLFYAEFKNCIIFSSEPKCIWALDKTYFYPNINSLSCFLNSGYVVGENSAFNNIKEINSASYSIFNENTVKNHTHSNQLWENIVKVRFKNKLPNNTYEKNSIKNRIQRTLIDSVKYRLVSDAKMGMYLSSGIDSSLILAMAKEIGLKDNFTAYTIVFDDNIFDEGDIANKVSNYLGVKHEKVLFTHNDFINELNSSTEIACNLHSNPAYFANSFLSKKASKDGVKAVLHGGGGDELCFGYDTYNASLISNNLSILSTLFNNFLKIIQPLIGESKQKIDLKYKFNKFIEVLKKPAETRHHLWRSIFDDKEWHKLKKFGFKHDAYLKNCIKIIEKNYHFNQFNFIEKCALEDFNIWWKYMGLPQGDLSGMSNGIEVRMPFMDKDVVNEFFKSSWISRYSFFNRKPLIKEIASDYFYKSSINFTKSGFHIPLREWFRAPLKDFLFLEKENLKKQKNLLLNYEMYNFFSNLLDDHIENRKDNSFKILNILVLKRWLNRYAQNI